MRVLAHAHKHRCTHKHKHTNANTNSNATAHESNKHTHTAAHKHSRTPQPHWTDKYACQYIPKIFSLVPLCPSLSRQIIMTTRIRTRDYTGGTQSLEYVHGDVQTQTGFIFAFACLCVYVHVHTRARRQTYTQACTGLDVGEGKIDT